MGIRTLQVDDLAKELEDLQEQKELGAELDEERLADLLELDDEIALGGAAEGETLIAARDFVEYAQELAEDVGAAPDTTQWPLYCIDWKWAARELEMDYTQVEFDGKDWLVRV
jgi:hypothetical protein